jgi:hypothetical protein
MTKHSQTVWVAALLSLTSAPSGAQPDAFWCGSRLIREGMAAADVITRCGEPDTRRVIEEPVYGSGAGGRRVRVGVSITEYWTYDRGTGRFPARVTVREGVAEQIELLRR